jgi:hypothetical protein
MLRRGDGLFIPASMVWCGFAIALESVAVTVGGSLVVELCFGSFVVLGLYLVLGRFFADAYWRGRTVYGVTDRRALIVTEIWRRRVRDYAIERLAEVDLFSEREGLGTLVFGRHDPSIQRDPPIFGLRRKNDPKPAFEVIDGPDEVLRVLRDAQRARQQKS